MSTTRVNHDATQDFIGSRIGTLLVTGAAARAGNERRYTVRCEQCQSQNTVRHSQLHHGTAKCLNASCGKPSQKRGRDLLSEHRQRIAEREAERAAEERELSELRMASEVDSVDWERKEAERQAAEEHRAAEEREAAEHQQRRRADGQRAYWRDAVLTGPDLKLYVTPKLIRASLPTVEAVSSHNLAEIEKFIQSTPEFLEYKTPANADAITEYFQRNGVVIFDAATLKAAFLRLRDLGVLVKRPAPTQQPVEQPKRVNLSAQLGPVKPAGPKLHRGRDQRTGEIRDFSEWEVRNMSANEYRRTFAVAPTVSELFTVMSGRDDV